MDQKKSASPERRLASLVVHPEAIEARYGSKTSHHHFRLRNTGNVPISIVEITTTCGCTLVNEVPKQAIDPGQECVVEVHAVPAAFGEKTSYLTVRTDPIVAHPIVVTVKLKGDVLPAPFVSYAPEVVTLSGTEPSSEATTEFEVQTVELAESPLLVSRNQCDLDGLRIWFDGDPITEPLLDGNVRRIYKLKVARRLPESDIEITTERHVIATTSVTSRPPQVVTFEARVTPSVKVVPSVVNLAVRRNHDTSAECVVVLIDSRGENERAQFKAKFDADWIRVESQKVVVQPNRSIQTFRIIVTPITMSDNVQDSVILSQISFLSETQDGPALKLPVRVQIE